MYGLVLLGFQTIMAPAVLTAAAYALGVYLAFRFGHALSDSPVLGWAFGFLLGFDFFYGLSYGLNLIRGWSWLGMFALWWGVVRVTDGKGRWSVGLLILGALISFGVGLDYFVLVISGAIGLAVCVAQHGDAASARQC